MYNVAWKLGEVDHLHCLGSVEPRIYLYAYKEGKWLFLTSRLQGGPTKVHKIALGLGFYALEIFINQKDGNLFARYDTNDSTQRAY